jgi:hypothetical protein
MRTWLLFAIPFGLLVSFSNSDRGRLRSADADGLPLLTAQLDQALDRHWEAKQVTPSPEADDLAFARRLWLDVLGTIPSLEEIREIEARPVEGRKQWLIDRALGDDRFQEVLAERLTRIAVGADAQQDDLLYRRRRMVSWMTGQVRKNRPWDELVRDLITAEGLSTDKPATNYVVSQAVDPIRLAARTTRAFLGVRIDCAQCHDHPFARWKQGDFEGLAAYFARLERNLAGVRDKKDGELKLDRPLISDAAELSEAAEAGETLTAPERTVMPRVPFASKLVVMADPKTGKELGRREVLARWLTHPENPYFAQALINRLWYWLMGRGLVEPLDELDSTKPRNRELLQLLADDLVAHGYDVKRAVRAIVSSRAYALDSRPAEGVEEEAAVDAMATYPLKQLRGDQLASAIIQSGTLWTHDRDRAMILRLARFFQRTNFAKRHADDLAREEPAEETLLQRLHLLNGELVSEITKDEDGLFGPVARIPGLAKDDAGAVEAAYLVVLTRRPTPPERDHFVAQLADAGKDADARRAAMGDLFWTLLNTTEFAWSH